MMKFGFLDGINIYKHRLGISVVLFLVLFITLYPFYQYILDDDGVGYATITRRWANGDFYRAINGLWSPLHCWLTVPFYKAGLDLMTAYKVSNACISVGILVVTHRLSQKSTIPKALQAVILLVTLPFLLYMSYCQLAGDILFCLLFLTYVNSSIQDGAFIKTPRIIALSIVAWLAYLSKAYAFPLFLLHFTIWQFWLYKQSIAKNKKVQLYKNLILGISVFCVLSLPWILALHYKYGIWNTSYAGKLNLNLDLMPYEPLVGLYFSIPPWPDSPTVWEDPFYVLNPYWQKFSVSKALLHLPKLLLHNLTALIQTFNKLSYVSIAITVSLFLYVVRHQSRLLALFILSIALLPSGYAILHLEDRYIWPVYFLLLISGTYLLYRFFQNICFSLSVQFICWIVFFSSFLITPLNSLQDLMWQDKEAFELGNLMKQKQFTGKVVSNAGFSIMRQIAFKSGSQYYESTPQNLFSPKLLTALQKLDIDYYYLFYGDENNLNFLKQSLPYKAAYERTPFTQHHMILLKMKP